MINKKRAMELGVAVVNSGERLRTDKDEVLEQLQALLPGVVNSDGQVDVQALSDMLGGENTTSNNQGYELTFAGKGLARAEADKPTGYELKIEQEQSKDFDNTGNVVIRGDNIEVLKILYQNYHQKIKMIYIDPPYNTKKENFIYKDNFKQSDKQLIEKFQMNEETADFLHNVYGTRSHSGWLSFMYPRLKLARELLSDDGVIFISIDNNEQASLKIMCDEIFGENNFIDSIIWNNKYTLQNDAEYTSSQYECILFYAKHKVNFTIGKAERTEKYDKDYKNPDNDPKGRWKATPLHAKSGNSASSYSVIFPNGVTWKNPDGRYPRYNKGKLLNLYEQGELYFNKKRGVDKKTYLSEVLKNNNGIVFSNLWLYDNVGHTHGNNEELASLVGKGIFDNPKGTKLIKQICKIANISENSCILDFFAGSGTTGDAVMRLNAEDGGNRQFILVQWDEAIDEKDSAEAYKFCTDNKFNPVISSLTIERLNLAGEKIKTDMKTKQGDLYDENKTPDIGYKVYSIKPKPAVIDNGTDDQLSLEIDNTRDFAIDTLVNMLCATCKPLHTPIECLVENILYKADNEFYLLGNLDKDELERYQTDHNVTQINLDGWADIDLEQYLNLGIHSGSEKANNIKVIY